METSTLSSPLACARQHHQIAFESARCRNPNGYLRSVELLGCVGVIVDAKDGAAEAFYAKHDFVTIDDTRWPRRMFVPMATIRALAAEP